MATLLDSNVPLNEHMPSGPPSPVSSVAESRANTTSMISVALSDIDEDKLPQEPYQTIIPPNFQIEEDIVLHTIPQSPKPSEPSASELEDGFHSRRQTAIISTRKSDSKRNSRATRKSHHVRGKSSLQEPDMAALLARLEMENNAIAKDPKAGIATVGAHTGPGAAFEYRVRDTVCSSLSLVNIPEEALGMSLGDFWAMVTRNYQEALTLLPTMTPLMIHKGVPPFLRSAVWVGIAGAWDAALQVEYDSLIERLLHEIPQNESIINKDLSRCFPQHELFEHADGDGQKMLGTVLKAYSLYDDEIGYCQGMAFLAGALLMNMPPKDAFCVFVRLMEHHNLRTLYSPSLSGLHSRAFQLKKLLASISSDLLEHTQNLGLEPAYLSQWFMTIFATTCPLNVLFRIYDVIFAEGADETIMRVALALILSNEQKIMAMTELEEVLHLLLGKVLWEPYQSEPDFLMDEIARLSNVVTREELDKLNDQFLAKAESEAGDKTVRALGFSSGFGGFRFLDGLWGGSSPAAEKKHATSPSSSNLLETAGHLPRRSVSKRSVATIDSSGGSGSGADSLLSNESQASTAITEPDREAGRDSAATFKSSRNARTEDRSLHEQVEGLLLALSEVQREAAQTAAKLKQEHARKESMASIVFRLRDLVSLKEQAEQAAIVEEPIKRDRRKTMPSRVAINQAEDVLKELNRKSRIITSVARSVSLNNLAHTTPDTDLQESLSRLCALLDSGEATPGAETPQSDFGSFFDGQAESSHNAEQDRLVCAKRGDSMRVMNLNRRASERSARQGLNVNNQFLNADAIRQSSIITSSSVYDQEDLMTPSDECLDRWPEAAMFDDEDQSPIVEKPINPRNSSLQAREIFETAGDRPPVDESLLLELVNVKTREAVAIQERDEMKVAVDRMKKQHDSMQARESEWTARLHEMERLMAAQEAAILAQNQAYTAEMERLKRAAAGKAVSTRAAPPPTIEVKPAERQHSLWPSSAPTPPEPTTPTSKSASPGGESAIPGTAGGWGWFSRSATKQRSVSTGNAAMQ